MRSIIYVLKKYSLVLIWPVILTTSYPTIPSGNDCATGDTVLIKETQQTIPEFQSGGPADEAEDNTEQKGPMKSSYCLGSKDEKASIVEYMVKGLTLPFLAWGIQYIYN